jgi:hypothetical protein
MPVQRSQGRPRPQVPRVDELPEGVAVLKPANAAMPPPPYAPGSAEAREAGRRGGQRKAGTTALAAGLGLSKAFADETFEPYRSAAENFARLQTRLLAETVGGGICEPDASSIVQSAALQLAASRWAFEVRGDVLLGSRLADASRANLMSARELCAKAAATRPRAPERAAPWLSTRPEE